MIRVEVVFPAIRVVDFDEDKKCLSGPSAVVLEEVAILDSGLIDDKDLHVPVNLADGGRLSIVFSGTPDELRDLVSRLDEATERL